jgi:hypothetical protein
MAILLALDIWTTSKLCRVMGVLNTVVIVGCFKTFCFFWSSYEFHKIKKQMNRPALVKAKEERAHLADEELKLALELTYAVLGLGLSFFPGLVSAVQVVVLNWDPTRTILLHRRFSSAKSLRDIAPPPN